MQPIDKLKYLKSYLSGDALRVVDGYRLTSDNYRVVVEALSEKFGNSETAIFAHFEKLFTIPSGQNESVKLQQIYDECEKHIRSLVALGLAEDTFGLVFIPLILSKLPRNIRVQLHRQNGSRKWTLPNLRSLMREELQALEMSDRYNNSATSSSFNGPSSSANSRNFNQPHSNSSNFRNFNQSQSNSSKSRNNFNSSSNRKSFPPTQGALVNHNQSNGPTCIFCSGSHYSDQCRKVPTVKGRLDIVTGHNCFKCLSPNHRANECTRKKPCFYCGIDRHHSSLCRDQAATSQSGVNPPRPGGGRSRM
jgi:hypothetical protein